MRSAAIVLAALSALPARAETCLRGVNLSGAEFGSLPGRPDHDYVYPGEAALKRLGKLGMTTVRLPFRWERLQPKLNEPLDIMELARLTDTVTWAEIAGLTPIIDLHNFGYYQKLQLGSEALPSSALADLWARLARHFRDRPKLVFSIMNEPYDINSAAWAQIQNAAIAAIRKEGANQLLLVTGTAYGGAHSWTADLPVGNNGRDLLGVKDPRDRYAYDFHQYLDADYSGRAAECSAAAGAHKAIGDVTAWLKAHDRRGFLGEFAASTRPECLTALRQVVTAVDANPRQWLGWTAWGAGAWWPQDYVFNLDPTPAGERAQMKLLLAHLETGKKTAACGRDAKP